ncbi:hypothetical protein [Methanocaldococcus infernus]
MKRIVEEINKIREELNLPKVNIDIVKIEEKDNKLVIYTRTRTDKSAIIGPGGWVVGKLRERLGYELIKVEDYTDYLLFLERVKEIKEKCNDEIILKLCSHFLENKSYDNLVYTTIVCQYDLYIAETLNKVFRVKALLLNPPILPEKKRKRAIEFLEERKISYEEIYLKPNFKESCGFLPKYLNLEGYIFTTCLKESYLKRGSSIYINFLKLFPLKFNKTYYLEFCPLCIQNLKNIYREVIKDIVNSVYLGIREPTDAAEEIVKIYKRMRK